MTPGSTAEGFAEQNAAEMHFPLFTHHNVSTQLCHFWIQHANATGKHFHKPADHLQNHVTSYVEPQEMNGNTSGALFHERDSEHSTVTHSPRASGLRAFLGYSIDSVLLNTDLPDSLTVSQ